MATDNNIGKDLAELLATHNFDVEMSNTQNNSATANDASVFKFDYVTQQGRNYGTAVIVIGDDNELMLFYGDNLGKGMEPEDKDEWFAFMKELKDFSIRHNFHNFSPRNLNSLKHTMQGMAAIKEGLFEGYYGTRKVSYMGEATDARLVIKHNKMIGENDKRYRYVESLFIETADQERFKLPFKNLAGGRAMLEHVRQGGRPYDVRGQHISETVNEMAVLSRFRRAQQGRVFEGVTQELVEQANAYYESLHAGLKHMATGHGYRKYFESWTPADIGAQEALVEDLKTMFIEQTLDNRIEAALPTLAKIQTRGQQMKEADIFESWANQLVEGTWALPDTPEAQEKLNQLMGSELIVGPDATNAKELLHDVIGDDILFDILADLAEQDPRANVWDDSDVQARLQELGIQMPEASAAPGEEAVPTDAEGTPPPTEVTPPPTDQQMMENQLRSMLANAGVPVAESRIVDESGETLQHILDRFKFEVKSFENGGELDNDLYDALYDYYASSGSMPYGVAKARTGDPFEWVTERLDQELGTGNYAPRLPETDNMATFVEGSCNNTMEGEYCPEHGLAECGTVAGGMAPVVMGEMDKPPHDDAINYNAAVTGSYYESDELARIKSLALLK